MATLGKQERNKNGDRCGIRAGCGLSSLRNDEFWDRLVEFRKITNSQDDNSWGIQGRTGGVFLLRESYYG